MLEVDDILPSPLTPLVLALTVPEPVCEMQTLALFTTAQSSPQPSPATSSSSWGELHLYIDRVTSSPSVPTGQQSSSQELLLQGTSQVPQLPPLFSTAHTAVSTSQPPIQPTNIPSWADEVATAEQVTPHQRRLSPNGRIPWSVTLVGSVEHDHDHSHWFTHRQ